jgi:hypothetical protein
MHDRQRQQRQTANRPLLFKLAIAYGWLAKASCLALLAIGAPILGLQRL